MSLPSSTFLADLETFLNGSSEPLAAVLRQVSLTPVNLPQGVDDSFFRLVMLGFATYDYHNRPNLWSEARIGFIREWATWAFNAEIQVGIDDATDPDFSALQGIVQQFKAREIPFFSSYMEDCFE